VASCQTEMENNIRLLCCQKAHWLHKPIFILICITFLLSLSLFVCKTATAQINLWLQDVSVTVMRRNRFCFDTWKRFCINGCPDKRPINPRISAPLDRWRLDRCPLGQVPSRTNVPLPQLTASFTHCVLTSLSQAVVTHQEY